MRAILVIFIGGGLGSVLRYLVNRWVLTWFHLSFPLGTFLVNVLGCFLIGFFIFYINKSQPLPLRLFLVTGFCGGFTTFSSFAFENVELIENQQIGVWLFYTLLSLILGFTFAWLGAIVGRNLF
ncbi:MAG: fluoride efflux transporter CrcB [Sphingobacteriales bacterium]|nr:fluoride efflux transporter CrcB [Sphingobacteriales bacterium]